MDNSPSIADITFDAWLDITFLGDDETSNTPLMGPYKVSAECNPSILLNHCTRLFESPAFVFDAYPRAAIARAMRKFQWSYGYLDVLAFETIALERRIACIAAMHPLFVQLFARDELGDACFMWWESYFSSAWGDGVQLRYIPQLNSATVDVLCEILQIPVRHCQMSALHGLSEAYTDINAARIGSAVDKFVASHPELDAELKMYALRAKEGDVP